MTTMIDASGREWVRIDDGSNAHRQLWVCPEADAHGWAVCLPGDYPDHATWSTTTHEAIARRWHEEPEW